MKTPRLGNIKTEGEPLGSANFSRCEVTKTEFACFNHLSDFDFDFDFDVQNSQSPSLQVSPHGIISQQPGDFISSIFKTTSRRTYLQPPTTQPASLTCRSVCTADPKRRDVLHLQPRTATHRLMYLENHRWRHQPRALRATDAPHIAQLLAALP